MPSPLLVDYDVLNYMVRHAMWDRPREACGVVIGVGDGPARQWVPMRNVAAGRHRYEMDAGDVVALHRGMDARGVGERVAVAYHSHPHSGADPSDADVAYAAHHPDVVHVIIGWDPDEGMQVRAFVVDAGRLRSVPFYAVPNVALAALRRSHRERVDTAECVPTSSGVRLRR